MVAQSTPTILYVDDDEDNRRSLALIFRHEGFRVTEAATGGEALRLVADKPDLVILDVNLPDITGFEVCRRLKAHPATTAIPVLHMSAVYVQPEDKTQALDGGADGYLIKPVDPRELLAHVRVLLRIHRAEEEAREAARQWRTTFDALRAAVCLLDARLSVLRCNRTLADLLGLPFAEIMGRPLPELARHVFGLAELPFLNDPPGGAHRRTQELFLADRWFHVTLDPMRDDSGEPSGSVYSLEDITEQKRMEEQLHRAQKLEAVGLLARGVAHDFNNLLTTITGNTALLLPRFAADDPVRESLGAISQAAWRGADLTRQLLSYSGQTILWLQPLDCNDAVTDALGLLRPLLDDTVAVSVRAAPDLWTIVADRRQVCQVLRNLGVNAREAMPHGGRLTVETANVTVSDEDLARQPESRPGEFVRLRVTDTGQGITPELLPRVFEPFFTTKEPGKGVGLGLATAYGIVKQHRGWIECASVPGRGTQFDIYFPRAAEGASRPVHAAPAASPAQGQETILLAADEPLARSLNQGILRRYGYDVLTSDDGAALAPTLAAYGARIRLLVLDIATPNNSVTATLRELRRLDSSVPVLLLGFSPPSERVVGDRPARVRVLQKPYRPEELADTVRDILDQACAARAVPI